MLKTELEIIKIFRENMLAKESIRGIMKNSGKKSYGTTFEGVKTLLKKEVLCATTQGKSRLCSLNLDNDLTLSYLGFLDAEEAYAKTPAKIVKNIRELAQSIQPDYFTLILTGSYAEGKATEKSGMDVAVIVEDDTDTKKVFNTLKNKGELMIPEAHPCVFKKSELLEMLLNEEMNYGKMMFKNRRIFFGAQNYYRMIRKAIKNGFKGYTALSVINRPAGKPRRSNNLKTFSLNRIRQ